MPFLKSWLNNFWRIWKRFRITWNLEITIKVESARLNWYRPYVNTVWWAKQWLCTCITKFTTFACRCLQDRNVNQMTEFKVLWKPKAHNSELFILFLTFLITSCHDFLFIDCVRRRRTHTNRVVFTEITLAGFVDQCRGYRSWCQAISAFGRHFGLADWHI